MRIHYNGKLTYARDLLSDLSLNRDDFNQFMDLALNNLSIEHARFSGTLDFFLYPYVSRPDYPPIFLSTPTGPKKGKVTITSFIKGCDATPENLARILDTIVDVDTSKRVTFFHRFLDFFLPSYEIKKYKKKIPEHKCAFKALPSFDLTEVIISESGGPGLDKEGFQKRGYPNLCCRSLDEGIMVRIHDFGRESKGFAHARIFSKVIPSAAILFFDESERERHDLQVVSDGGWYVFHPEKELRAVMHYLQGN